MLCVLIYTQTNCGLRTVIKILDIFEGVLGGACGKAPSYNTVSGWVRKLGLSVYEDQKPADYKYAVIMDESIMVNREKLLLTLGIPGDHTGRAVRHSDVKVLGMQVGDVFKGEDVKNEIARISDEIGAEPDYAISDEGHNLVSGIASAGISHHHDISHALGNCMKRVYGKDSEFMELTTKLGKIRLQYHLTDKAWLLPPNMRSIARFMNLDKWVDWASRMLGCHDSLDDKMKDAYAFLLDYRELIGELDVCIKAIRHLEDVCKNRGFSKESCEDCMRYVIRNVIGNANNRRATLGLRLLDYFKRERSVLGKTETARNISSDIIESDFGIFKAKQSPNKLYGMTSLVLMLPLYPKIIDYSVSKEQDFKERLANVKLKDVDLWAKENLSQNWVATRIKTLTKAS